MDQVPRRIDLVGDEGVRIAAEIYGRPVNGSVILAHGGGQTRHAWGQAAVSLARAGWRAVALDLRGHGESEWSPTGDYGIARFARDLELVAGQLEDRPACVGASLGGLAGLYVEAVSAPRTFASLTLVDITPHMEPAGVERIMGFMSQHVEDGFASLEEAADVIAAYLPHRPRRDDLSGLSKNLRRGEDGRFRWHWDPRFVESVTEGRKTKDFSGDSFPLEAVSVPLHLVRGAMSELVSLDAVAKFRAAAPSAAYTDIADAGHMVAGDRNDAFTSAIVAFLQSGRSS